MMSRRLAVTPRMGLVFFAFGVAQVPTGEPLAGAVLLRLLADLGLSQAAARSLLLRMRRGGWLDSERSGREAAYRLAPVYNAAQGRLDRHLRGEPPPWTGSFGGVLYEIPEHSRAFRDQLRSTAQLLGYAPLRPGLLVGTTDRWDELASLLPPRPARSRVLRAALTFSAEESREVAAQLWDLESIAARYRAVAAQAASRADQAERYPPDGAAAFRAFAAATLPVYEAGADDPGLPAELLPPDWPADQLTAAVGRAFSVFGPLMAEYLAAVTKARTTV